ncbi:hypothetical protein [Erwinia sp. V71]
MDKKQLIINHDKNNYGNRNDDNFRAGDNVWREYLLAKEQATGIYRRLTG